MTGEIKIGDTAPEFNLFNQNGEEVKMSDLKGSWIVLYFYPKDNTAGCTQEALDFSEYKDRFAEMGVQIYGMSKDSVKSHKSFAEKKNLTINLLSDENIDTIKNYCVWGTKKLYGKEYEGVIRTTYIINDKQEIVYIWKNVKVKNHVEEVLNKLKELKNSKE